jgi:hypothetical protein
VGAHVALSGTRACEAPDGLTVAEFIEWHRREDERIVREYEQPVALPAMSADDVPH